MSKAVAVDQAQKPQSNLLLYKPDNAYLQSNPVQQQVSQLWSTLSEEDTAAVYQQAAAKTWTLLKQIASLIVFIVIAIVALTVWLWGVGFRSGLQFRQWIEVEHPTSDELVGAFLKVLIWPLERAFEWADRFVKNYLGWELHFDLVKPKPEPTDETPVPTSTSTSTPTSAPSDTAP